MENKCVQEEPIPPEVQWASACEEAMREVEKVGFEEKGDMAIKQAAKLLALAVRLHYGKEGESAEKLEEVHINSSEDKQMLAQRFLSLPFRYQRAIMNRLELFTEKEFEWFNDNELYVKFFQRVSMKELKEEIDKYYEAPKSNG